ncbi:alpha/beta hydrolase [Paludisphaera borealis]|uniref:Alpha/beta hydrolase n=1 Tax=Paludisphaera borealis TaxID=1387353 RepID=A0A1U7CTS1_9BACT|nr:alpha/beta hydrolase [Paludisphaera borealis]APW62273.1 alpha/beta hydrolase [Paludisphaera borealis]
MMRRFTICICLSFLFCLSAVATAADRKPTTTLDVWPGAAPGEVGAVGPEHFVDAKPGEREVKRLTNVSHPTLTVFRPDPAKDTGAAVVICPGGGYHILAWDLEGEEVAAWLNSIGVTGIVLKYRVPRREGTPDNQSPAQPLMDAQRALKVVRSKASEWGIDPHRIGMLGFSAGGHLTAAAATRSDESTYPQTDGIDKQSARPDFAVLVYPGGMDKKDDPANPIAHVTSQAPPMFLAHAGDDKVSPLNSVDMYAALKKAGVPAELHVFATGGHGFGLRPSADPCSTWPKRCEEWLRVMKFIPKADAAK